MGLILSSGRSQHGSSGFSLFKKRVRHPRQSMSCVIASDRLHSLHLPRRLVAIFNDPQFVQ